MKTIIQYLYYPTLLILSWIIFFIISHNMPDINLHNLAYSIGFSAVIIVWISEYLFPYRKEWLVNHNDFAADFFSTNILLPILSKLAEMTIVMVLPFFVTNHFKNSLQLIWPAHWPLMFQLVLILLICEFFFYWYHRIAHTFLPLWHFHAVHHCAKRVYWNNSGKFHPIDLFLNWFIYFSPLFIFAVPEKLIALFLITNGVTGLLEHSNIDFKLGHLNRIFNSAELHRWHHSMLSIESNSNYGKVISFWDQVFNSYYYDSKKEVGDVGVRGDVVPKSFWSQLLYPLQKLFSSN